MKGELGGTGRQRIEDEGEQKEGHQEGKLGANLTPMQKGGTG